MSATDAPAAAPTTEAPVSPTQSVRLGIEGMHCASCASIIDCDATTDSGELNSCCAHSMSAKWHRSAIPAIDAAVSRIIRYPFVETSRSGRATAGAVRRDIRSYVFLIGPSTV